MGCLRVLLCLLLPPLAVLDYGCGAIAMVCILTLFGWVPGAIAALIVCSSQRPATTTIYYAPTGQLLPPDASRPRALKPLAMAGAIGAVILGLVFINVVTQFFRGPRTTSRPAADTPRQVVLSTTPPVTAAPDASAQSRYAEHVDWIAHKLPPSVKDSQASAVAKYPALLQPGSSLSEAFVAFYRDAFARKDAVVYLHSWPETIADECYARLHAPAAQTAPEAASPDVVDYQPEASVRPSVSAAAARPRDPHAGQVYVQPYRKKDGTMVQGYWRDR